MTDNEYIKTRKTAADALIYWAKTGMRQFTRRMVLYIFFCPTCKHSKNPHSFSDIIQTKLDNLCGVKENHIYLTFNFINTNNQKSCILRQTGISSQIQHSQSLCFCINIQQLQIYTFSSSPHKPRKQDLPTTCAQPPPSVCTSATPNVHNL